MRVFEFHFNPKLIEDLIFDTFCYEPSNIYEKKLGNLYIAGLLKNVLPKNLKFLDNLAEIIKNEYYSQIRLKPEEALKESLKLANEHLEKIAKKGDVSWLGNLNFAVLSISPQKNFWEINFTKTGKIKIFLSRRNRFINIGKELEVEDIEPYPLKIFTNVVSGKLDVFDKIFLFNQEIYDLFLNKGLLEKIVQTPELNEKKLKEILKISEKEILQTSGFFLFCDLGLPKIEEKSKPVIFEKVEKFSWFETFAPFIKFTKKILTIFYQFFYKLFYNILNFLKINRFIKNFTLPIKKHKFKKNFLIKEILLFPKRIKLLIINKNTILILILIFVLTSGFFIFQREKINRLKETENKLNEIQEILTKAEGLLILKEIQPEAIKNANILLQEAWDKVLPLTKKENPLSEKIVFLKNSIETHLFDINKLETNPTSTLVFEFNQKVYIPQKMMLSGKEKENYNLYFFTPYAKDIFRLKGNEVKIIETEEPFHLAVPTETGILFFTKPNKLVFYDENAFKEQFFVKEPYPDFNFTDLAYYKGNIYFLDPNKGEIVKYSLFLEKEKSEPILWLNQKTKKVFKAQSIAMDGGIWVLTNENKIDRFYGGKFQKTLDVNIFPYPKNITKIFTSPTLPYLYLFEPNQSRLIIIDKEGNIIKQFQNKNFDNLIDFAISPDGKTIWLLNGLKVYQIKI